MMPHDIFTMYSAKAIEYLIAVVFMLLFIPFWRFVNSGPAARVAALAVRPARVPRLAEWFAVPERVFFHPGHAWARVDGDGLVTAGMDDFAQKLIGPLGGIRLPAVGARLAQGEPGWSLQADGRSVDMLSPVDGIVVDVNRGATRPGAPAPDPYQEGWLVKVRPTRLSANVKSLLGGEAARRWTAAAADALRGRLSPELGLAYQDGGVPVHGIARSLEPTHWDQLAREFFLTEAPDAGRLGPDA